jgi:uncharacterized protein
MHVAEKVRSPLVMFIIITFGLSSIFWASMILAGSYLVNSGLNLLLLLWCPAIAAFATSYYYREGVRGFGFRLGRVRYLVAGYCVPVVYAATSIGIIVVLGLGDYGGNVSFDQYGTLLGFVTVGTTLTMIAAIGEEVGWRGFLVPHLAKSRNFTGVALVSGLIGAIWHYPLFLTLDYSAAGLPLWYAIPVFTVLAIGLSFALAWLRLKSGSVWPAVFFHASWNLWALYFFVPLISQKATTKYFISETGAVTAVVVLIGALVFWRLRSALPQIT